jgi:transposase
MSKRYRPYQPNQCYLLPPSPDEWLPEDHLARFVSDIVDALDLSGIYASYEKELRGYPPYSPCMMVKVLIYAYSTGVSRPGRSNAVSPKALRLGTWLQVTSRIFAPSTRFANAI